MVEVNLRARPMPSDELSNSDEPILSSAAEQGSDTEAVSPSSQNQKKAPDVTITST